MSEGYALYVPQRNGKSISDYNKMKSRKGVSYNYISVGRTSFCVYNKSTREVCSFSLYTGAKNYISYMPSKRKKVVLGRDELNILNDLNEIKVSKVKHLLECDSDFKDEFYEMFNSITE